MCSPFNSNEQKNFNLLPWFWTRLTNFETCPECLPLNFEVPIAIKVNDLPLEALNIIYFK